MAKNTEISLRNKVIYSVYVRNHTNDGTFNAVAEDLDRIKSLGTDIIWFMPIHPIGVKNKKALSAVLMQTRTIAQQIRNTEQWTISRALLKNSRQGHEVHH